VKPSHPADDTGRVCLQAFTKVYMVATYVDFGLFVFVIDAPAC
jgi:hypothetical protein